MGSVYYYQLHLNDSKFAREKMNAFDRKMNRPDYTISFQLPWSNKGIKHTLSEKEKIDFFSSI
jgi:thymidylate kinase